MCIICKIKQAGISEEALEMVEALGKFAVVSAKLIARLKAEQSASLNAEEELALLGLATMFEMPPAPEGMPADVWAALPANLRDVINRATTNGAKLQVISLQDMRADESITKH